MYEQPQLVRMDSRKKVMMERRRSSSMREQERPETVDLSGRNLESLVPSPSLNLRIIYKLDLSNNNLQMIPESLIARMLNLVVLDLHSNQLRALPNSIGCLSKLKVLNLAGNNLELLPKTIENCSLNWLQALPEDLENLTDLQVLNVSQNFHHLTSLPYSIGLLLSLVELNASYNNIRALPDSMGCLGKLRKLRIEGNPLVSPPMEVVRQGVEEVKMYLSEKMNNNHISPRKKTNKKTWIRKLVRYGTFNSRCTTPHANDEERKGSKMLDGSRSKVEGCFCKIKKLPNESGRIGSDYPPEGETVRKRRWAGLGVGPLGALGRMDLGWTCEATELDRGPLVEGRSGLPRTAAMTLRAAVLALGRRGEGWSGRRSRF
ncbi:hypothetical protein CRG98_026981 [Punica granatum]|uniref:Plant intracellular Ras-group-related LRR protein 6-like n=1 Tax=Punica granatum TaxID=22663 RepID=A0A2I0J8R1_PUNGR|nr:hypothetical protein CRG98_026981 [Punica granatum]